MITGMQKDCEDEPLMLVKKLAVEAREVQTVTSF